MSMKSYSYDFLSTVCSVGMDKTYFDELPGDVSRMSTFGDFLPKEELLSPKDHGCDGPGQVSCYNVDTGICNFTEEWCNYMGMGLRIPKKMPGTGLVDYHTCEKSTMQDVAGFIISDIGTQEIMRAIA